MVCSLVCHNSDNVDAVKTLTGSEKPQAAARNCPVSNYIRMADIFRLLNLSHHWPLWMQCISFGLLQTTGTKMS